MLSDVDATVASTPKQPQREASNSSTEQPSRNGRPSRQEQPGPPQQAYQSPAQPFDGSSAAKWLFGIAAVTGVIWFVSQSDHTSSPRSTYSPGPSSTTAAPTPAGRPQVIQPRTPSRLAEEKPAVGRNNVLSTAQVRYCLAEKIRLDAADSVVDSYVDTDVDRFNRYINDYNSRCGEFRYRQGVLESARSDIEPYRSQLQAEGRTRFVRSPSATTSPPAPAQALQSTRPAPDATVQAIQQRLNELGYSAGPADGLLGPKTQAAIRAFQRDIGVAADGNASPALLARLRR